MLAALLMIAADPAAGFCPTFDPGLPVYDERQWRDWDWLNRSQLDMKNCAYAEEARREHRQKKVSPLRRRQSQ